MKNDVEFKYAGGGFDVSHDPYTSSFGRVSTGFRPSGTWSILEYSISPYAVKTSDRGIGVAVMTKMSALFPLFESASR